MKERLIAVILLLTFPIFTSCAKLNNEGAVTVVDKALDTAGNVTNEITTTVGGTSQYKEMVYTDMRKNRDNARKDAYATEGLNLEFGQVKKEVALEGTIGNQPVNLKVSYMETTITKVTHKEPINFDNDPLPNGPSEHPVWRTFGNVFNTAAKFTLYGYVAKQFKDIFTSDNMNGGSNFNGDNYDFGTSFNELGNENTFTPSRIQYAPLEEAEEEVIEEGLL